MQIDCYMSAATHLSVIKLHCRIWVIKEKRGSCMNINISNQKINMAYELNGDYYVLAGEDEQ